MSMRDLFLLCLRVSGPFQRGDSVERGGGFTVPVGSSPSDHAQPFWLSKNSSRPRVRGPVVERWEEREERREVLGDVVNVRVCDLRFLSEYVVPDLTIRQGEAYGGD